MLAEMSVRDRIRSSGTRAERQAYFEEVSITKRETLARRRELGRAHLEAHQFVDCPISRETGLGQFDLRSSPLFHAARDEAEAFYAKRPAGTRPSKGSLEFTAGQNDFTNQSAITKLAASPALFGPVTAYFDCLPILFSIGLSRAGSGQLLAHSSHLFHLDPEDVTQVKVFVNISDVDLDRAFYALPADQSQRVVSALSYSGGRLSDDRVGEVVGLSSLVNSSGPSGMATACDTNRCLHYGGRPGKRERRMLDITYVLPTSTWFPRDAHDGERRVLLSGLSPVKDDPIWNALTGHSLT